MVQTSNRNLGPSIFAFRSGSLTQAKIYTSGRRNVSSLKHQTRALQSPAFCYVACSRYTDFCENSWTTQSSRLQPHGMGHSLFYKRLILFKIKCCSAYAQKKTPTENIDHALTKWYKLLLSAPSYSVDRFSPVQWGLQIQPKLQRWSWADLQQPRGKPEMLM